jgi:hypothetical protein
LKNIASKTQKGKEHYKSSTFEFQPCSNSACLLTILVYVDSPNVSLESIDSGSTPVLKYSTRPLSISKWPRRWASFHSNTRKARTNSWPSCFHMPPTVVLSLWMRIASSCSPRIIFLNYPVTFLLQPPRHIGIGTDLNIRTRLSGRSRS